MSISYLSLTAVILIIIVFFNKDSDETKALCATNPCRIEYHLSRAEIFYKEQNIEQAIEDAQKALALCDNTESSKDEKAISLRIFIARCYSKLGELDISNEVYRSLIDEKVYLPPVLLGLMHNNLSEDKHEKVKRNMTLVKIYLGDA